MRKNFILVIVLIACLHIHAGPISKLYVTEWYNSGISVIQGNAVVNHWANAGVGEIAIAVNTTIQTFGHYYTSAYNTGAQYTLNGAYMGQTYIKTTSSGTYTHDGTTDGTYNYTIDYGSTVGAVYRYDSSWNNPTLLFQTGYGSELGITYDPTNDSFWISNWGNGTIRNYSRTGTLLSSFSTSISYIGALALDHANGTLWFNNQASNSFLNYTKTGVYLGTSTISGLSGSVYGGEFSYTLATVPEPASVYFVAMMIGIFVLIRKK